MEVDCDTHLMPIQHKLKSIWYKLKSFRSKSELEEILVKVFSRSHRNMIAIDRKNVIPEGEKSCLFGGLELFLLAKYDELLRNQPESKGSQMSFTVEQIVQYRLSIQSMEIP